MPLILGPEAVRAATNMRQMIDLIDAGILEQAQGHVEVPPRQNLVTSNGFFRVMPAVLRGRGLMGFKIFNGSVEHGVRYLIGIYNERSGELLALMDAAYLTGARTGATTGVATRYQARANSASVGVIGAGLEARTNLSAVCAVRSIRRAKVFSPTPANRERFAVEMAETLNIEITPCASPEAAVCGTDIVVVATNTTKSNNAFAYFGAWMEPGQHVNSIGSTGGKLREVDPATFTRAERILVDSLTQVEEECGDVLETRAQGLWDRGKVQELTTVVAGTPGRERDAQITLFKSVGTGLQDVIAGFAIYEEAKRLGLGQQIDDFLEHKRF
jgi:ornithine cyclodeaminase/alanine dehydrogenase-like protein (mu-crystallin family)